MAWPNKSRGSAVSSPSGSGGGVHTTIQDIGNSSRGVEIQYGRDATWALDAQQRDPGTRASMSLPGSIADSSLAITLPYGLAVGEEGNDWDFVIRRGDPAVAAVAGVNGTLNIIASGGNGIRVTIVDPSGAEGNGWSIRMSREPSGYATPVSFVDVTNKVVEFRHSAGANTFNTWVSVINGLANNNVDFTAALLPGTSGDIVPQIGNFNGVVTIPFTGGVTQVAAVAREPISARINGTNIELTARPAEIFSDILPVLRALSYNAAGDLLGDAIQVVEPTATLRASQLSDVVTSASRSFSGGVDPENRLIDLDVTEKVIVVKYHQDIDTLGDLVDLIDGGVSGLSAVLIHFSEENSHPEAAGFIRAFRGATGDGGGGGGGVSSSVTALRPLTWAQVSTPSVGSLGRVENIEGTLYEHERRHHDGNSKTIGGTGSPGTWITLNHADFLGFYTHSHPPPDSAFTHGKFYYGRDYGSFLIHRVHGQSGFTGVTGNFTYDPFDEGEPWHDVTIDGEEVDLNFRGGVDHLSIAFAAANGIGEVFANRGVNEIVYVSEFVAQSAGYDEYFRRIYIPPGVVRPIVEFWGSGQASASPTTPIDRSRTANSYLRYPWKSASPDVVIGYDFGIRAVGAADATGVDLITGETSVGNRRVFKFPPGDYWITFNAAHKASADTHLAVWVICVKVGTDQTSHFSSGGYNTVQDYPIPGTANLDRLVTSLSFARRLRLSDETLLTVISGTFASDVFVDGVHSITIEKLD